MRGPNDKPAHQYTDGSRGGRQYRDVCGKCGARRVDRQLGSEPTVQEYVERLVAVFRELRRVLRDTGVVWCNLGDSYLKNGSLAGVPWAVAEAMKTDGWILRQEVIFAKKSPMPESVNNRCTRSHEQIFMFTKGRDYFYDNEAIKEGGTGRARMNHVMKGAGQSRARMNHVMKGAGQKGFEIRDGFLSSSTEEYHSRNKRSVWTVAHGGGYAGCHYATFPSALIEPCILAGTSEKGCCPDCRAPWERVVASRSINPWGERKARGAQAGSKERGSNENHGEGMSHTLGAHVRTLGWRPGCRCYGLAVIGDSPSEPNQGPSESDASFEERHSRWRDKQGQWEAQWRVLEPAYEQVLDPDGDGSNAGNVPCVVLDPFIGSGTTALVSLEHGRACWGIDLSREYLDNHCIERVRRSLLDRPATRGLVPRE